MTKDAQLKAMGEEMIRRKVTWRGRRITRLDVFPVEGSASVRIKVRGKEEQYYSLEQWIFDRRFELARCLAEGTTYAEVREYLSSAILHALNGEPYIQYLLNSLDLHGEEGSKNEN